MQEHSAKHRFTPSSSVTLCVRMILSVLFFCFFFSDDYCRSSSTYMTSPRKHLIWRLTTIKTTFINIIENTNFQIFSNFVQNDNPALLVFAQLQSQLILDDLSRFSLVNEQRLRINSLYKHFTVEKMELYRQKWKWSLHS